jgi:superfamily II DNA or RNA helicase
MSSTAPSLNTRVLHRAHPEYGFGIVRYVEEDAFGNSRFQIAFDHLDNLQIVPPTDLDPVAEPFADAEAGKWGLPAAFQRKLAAGLILGVNNVTSAFTKAAVQPLPHQAFLLDKVLSAERFGHVLADDVGLGKTIEAGFLITCLLRREPPQRILVVCPAGLALQWQDDMDDLFGLNFAIMGDNFDGKLTASWRTQPLVIAPIDRLKREQYRELLTQVGTFDVVVCDEAHRLTAQRRFLSQKLEKTANYQLFEFLVESRLIYHVENHDHTPRSPRLLLLSATPHQGDDERFLYLLHLVRPDLFQTDSRPIDDQLAAEPLKETLTRTPKSRAIDWDGKPLFKGHTTTTLDVQWTPAEMEISRLLTEYILKSLDFSRSSERAMQLVIQLVMHTFHKLAASSWPALEHALQRRLDSLNGRAARLNEFLQGQDDDDEESDMSDAVIPTQAFFANERALLETLLSQLRALPGDSKWNTCSQLFREIERAEPNAKVLLFTQYRATLKMLVDRVPSLFPNESLEVIHGDMSMQDRRRARIRFETSSRFLLSTEAGGEGLNLHKACHLMVNYDFPWNPMRLQQRIGRLDRYGQKQVVRVFNLRVPDSWDQHISTRIEERLEVIQRTMALAGPGALEDYREMILGQVAQQIDPDRLFAESRSGGTPSDSEMDNWIRTALDSVSRWQTLFNTGLGLAGDPTHLRPTLTSEHFKEAYRLACENHEIRLRDSRNSQNQPISGVFNLDLPKAFRDPIFRPSKTIHVVFDRDVFSAVRGQDLGSVRGQPIRPLLAGLGEPFTDWLFQTAMHARHTESAFAIKAAKQWPHGPGWLLVFALRWLGKARRLSAPDSIVPCFLKSSEDVITLSPTDAMLLLQNAESSPQPLPPPSPSAQSAARTAAQQALREHVSTRDPLARSAANLSLLFAAAITQ